jgi:hypothetical protein
MNIECIREFANYKGYKYEIEKSEIIYDRDINSIIVQRLRIHFWNISKTFTFLINFNINTYIQFERNYKLTKLGL